jgi:hypothetical protein
MVLCDFKKIKYTENIKIGTLFFLNNKNVFEITISQYKNVILNQIADNVSFGITICKRRKISIFN